MHFKVLALLLVLSCCVTPAFGFEDDFEGQLTDQWADIGDSGYSEIVNYPSEYPTAHSLKIRSYELPNSYTKYQGQIVTQNLIDSSYIAFTVHDATATEHNSLYFYVQYYNEFGGLVFESNIKDDCLNYNNGDRFELVKDGTDIDLYVNGDFIRHLGTMSGDYDNVLLSFYCDDDTFGSIPSFSQIYYIDDVSTSSILGIDGEWSPINNNITTSYAIKYKTSFPSSSYTIDLIRVSDTYIVDTETVTDYNGFVQWNRNSVFEENYGLYKLDLQRDDSSLTTKYFTYITSDNIGSIAFDQDNYVSDEIATISYSLSSPDFTTYTYQAEITDLTGATLATETITSLSGSYDYTFTDYDTGSYYVLFNRVTKSTGTEVLFAYDYCDINEALKIEGTTYLFDGSTVGSADVSLLQGSTYYNSTSNATGWYSQEDLSVDVATTFNASNATTELAPFTFTPETAGVLNVDLILFPDMTDYWGAGDTTAYGLIYGTYHQPIEGATVKISNDTWSDTTTASSTGFYMFNDLVDASEYTINASMSGYDNSENFTVSMSGNTRQDIELTARYTVVVKVKDATTEAYVSSFDAYLNGDVASTTTGTVTFSDVTYGAYSVSATAENYYSDSKTYVIDEDRTITFELNQLESQYYQPHYVEFVVQTIWGSKYDGVTVTAYEGSTAAGDTYASGITGDDGSIAFQMDQNQQYTITFISSEDGIDESITIYPVDTKYTIYPTTDSYERVYDDIKFGAYGESINLTAGMINASFIDNSGTTTLAELWINDQNDNNLYYFNTTSSSQDWSQVVNTTNTSTFLVHFQLANSELTDGFTQDRIIKIQFDEGPSGPFDFGFEEQWHYQLLATGMILFVGLLFGAVNAQFGSIVVVLLGWFNVYTGWFPSNVKTILMMMLATLVAFAFYIRKGEDIR